MFARSAFCDVTPRGREVRLAGYAARREPTSRILDAIEISAVLLEQGDRRCLIFSFDLMIVGSELSEAIQVRLGAIRPPRSCCSPRTRIRHPRPTVPVNGLASPQG